MDQKAKQFLTHHRIAVLSLLQEDGVVHSATLNFSFSENPLTFFYCTGKSTDKCRSLLKGQKIPASLVIGFSEEEYATIQAEGEVEIVENDDTGWEAYGKKFPNRAGGKNNPEVAMLKFTPNWLRYRDYKEDPAYESIIIEKSGQKKKKWQKLFR